VMYFCI